MINVQINTFLPNVPRSLSQWEKRCAGAAVLRTSALMIYRNLMNGPQSGASQCRRQRNQGIQNSQLVYIQRDIENFPTFNRDQMSLLWPELDDGM